MIKQDISDHYTRYGMNVRFGYCRVGERGLRRNSGQTRDLNFRGASVELPERVRPGSTLEITLATPVGNLPLVAHVTWARPDLPKAPYLHGLRFTGVTPDRREQLSTLFAHDNSLRRVRLYCRLAATWQRKGVACPEMLGSIRDISDSGVGLRLPERVAPGTELHISATTSFGRIAAAATVVWVDQAPAGLPRGASYHHGLRFLYLDPLSELPLRALLDGIR